MKLFYFFSIAGTAAIAVTTSPSAAATPANFYDVVPPIPNGSSCRISCFDGSDASPVPCTNGNVLVACSCLFSLEDKESRTCGSGWCPEGDSYTWVPEECSRPESRHSSLDGQPDFTQTTSTSFAPSETASENNVFGEDDGEDGEEGFATRMSVPLVLVAVVAVIGILL